MKGRENIYKITAIVLMIDQFIKLIINKNLPVGGRIKVIPDFFSIFYLKNTGAAFSILEDNTILLTIISVIVVVILDRIIKSQNEYTRIEEISYGLVMGGIFGNLIDRIIHHGVIDYLAFDFGTYHFPVFNLADMSIVIGVAMLFINMILEKKKVIQDERNIL